MGGSWTQEQKDRARNRSLALWANPKYREKKTTQRGLAVDHCHVTNVVRGLLCQGCNLGIGGLKDDIWLLQKAIKYLEDSIVFS